MLFRSKDIKKDLKANNGSDSEMNRLKERLEDTEARISETRIKIAEIEEKLLTEEELKEALLVTSPIWDTLFPQAKREVLRLLLKQVDYDAREGKLGVTLNERGVKLLCSKMEGVKDEV